MATSALVTHCGARLVRLEELATVEAPPPTESWFPIKHSVVVESVGQAPVDAGFSIQKAQFALSRNDARLFGTLDLTSGLGGGVHLCVGVRNSIDKSLPLGFCAGNRVFVCDNLCFRSELLVKRKHTRFGSERFREAICKAVRSLHSFREQESARIKRFQHLTCDDGTAESLMLRAFERGIVSARLLPSLIREWRSPSFEDFRERTYWSLENAFTTVLGSVASTNPQRFCGLTISLQGLLAQAAGPTLLPMATPA